MIISPAQDALDTAPWSTQRNPLTGGAAGRPRVRVLGRRKEG